MIEQTQRVEPNGAPELKTLIEAFILVSDGPVSFETLAQALAQDVTTIDFVVAELEGEYATRGIRLQKMRERVQFVSAPEVSEQVQKYLGLDTAPRLSAAALETLAIIAYRQPITRPQIEALRGVNCDGVVHTLLARGLVEAVGELETVGHPTLYGTTFDFLQYFGLTSLEQLPPLPENMLPALPSRMEQIESGADNDAPNESDAAPRLTLDDAAARVENADARRAEISNAAASEEARALEDVEPDSITNAWFDTVW